MKKHSFYSLMCQNHKPRAVLHHGYSDGTFYYYATGEQYKIWYAIHPLIGLSVTYGYTRKECAEKAHAPELLKAIARKMEQSGAKFTADFEKAIRETT